MLHPPACYFQRCSSLSMQSLQMQSFAVGVTPSKLYISIIYNIYLGIFLLIEHLFSSA